MGGIRNELTIESIMIAVLGLVAAGLGVFWTGGGGSFEFETLRGEIVTIQGQGLYRYDTVSFATQAIAQDWVTLVVGVPLLLVSAFMQRSGRLLGQLLLAGTLGYFAYTYVSYALGDAYNELFLCYVVLMTLSLFALIRSIMAIDIAALPGRFTEKLPRKRVAAFMFVVGAFLSVAWLGRIVPALFASVPPPGLESYTTLPIQVLDLGVIVPLSILTGVLLLQGRPWGYLLASVVLIKGVTLSLAVSAMAFNMVRTGVPISPVEATVFPLLTVLSVTLTVLFLRSLKPDK